MPFHTDNTGKIPYSFKSMPKNLMEESHKVDNKFLNNHLSEIEEATDKKLLEKNSFIHQQVKYHKESGILNHDNFFHCDLATGTQISNDNFHHSNFVINPYTFVASCETLETGNASSSGNFGSNIVWSAKLPNGVIGCKYDQVAMNIDSLSSANMNLAVYDDSGGSPNNLYESTSPHSASAGFNLKSVTEFTLSTVSNWSAMVKNANVELFNNSSGVRKRDANTSSLSVPDPYTTDSTDTGELNMKIAHS